MGTLFYVVGASGAGKDSLMTYARARLDGTTPVFFAHRYITRPAEAGGENHVSISPGEFRQLQALGLLALSWESHGLCYGVGREVELWLAAGAHVVLNGSRAFLPAATQRFPELTVVLIEVSAAVLGARLAARGRESPDAIAARLARAAEFTVLHPRLITIRNDGPLPEAGDQLLALLRATPPAPAPAGA
jgi:ribose 1,5-bisphosphokinase